MNWHAQLTIALTAMAVVVCARGVAAQPTQAQPLSTDEPARRFDVAADVFGGWDFDLSGVDGTLPGTVPLVGTDYSYGGVNGTMDYVRTLGRVSVGLGGAASVRRRWGLGDDFIPSYSGSFIANGRMGRRTTWGLSQRVGYAPLNALSFYPATTGGVPIAVVDYQIADSEQLTSETSGSLTRGLTRRGQLSLHAGYWTLQNPTAVGTGVDEGEDEGDIATATSAEPGLLHRWTVGGRYSHHMTRYMTLYGGYTYSRSNRPGTFFAPGGASDPTLHYIDAGVGYQRPFSFSRRTTMSVQAGTNLVNAATPGREFSIIGSANLRHQLGRTWLLNAVYERMTRFVAAFVDPVNTNGVTAGTEGRLGRPGHVRIFANWSRGHVGATEDGNSISSYAASAQYRHALKRHFGLYAEYFYFQSQFGADVPLPDEFGRDLRRNGIRFGVSFGTTLLGPTR